MRDKNVPPDLSICTFVLEQSLSVRALQEMLANTEEKAEGRDGGSQLEVDTCFRLLGVLLTHLKLAISPESKRLMCGMMFLEHSGTVTVELKENCSQYNSVIEVE
ncbi:hypothetical protein WISP_127879 [Willisornis vidua]|uniref:Uncharacterized protein n=1 Tax=Willisornis vidua TaxID=1566151 RepID=A0ABQ9CQJ5_9PASS|nr:hypothetical protein WISP_127879 [Willisornis vidua]